jgi:HAD superfamily hydrolase (TIGR01509 family)
MIKAVLWDMDGTLVDSLGLHWIAWRDIAAAAGITVTYGQFVSTLGKRNDEILLEWFGPDVDPTYAARLSLDKEARYRELIRTEGIRPSPGVMTWIARLRAAGWKQAVATSAPRLNEEAVVDALRMADLFDARIAAEDVTHGKPHPEVFLVAAARVGASRHRAIVVEDAAAGIEAGRRAGMRTIGVSANGPLPGADIVVSSLADLPEDAFERLLG